MGNVRAYSRKQPWTDAEVALLTASYPTSKRKTIADLFPARSASSIETKAHLLGLARRPVIARTAEQTREAKRIDMAQRRLLDPEKAIAKERAWRAANPDRVKANLKKYAERRFFWIRSVRLKQSIKATPAELSRLWKTQRGRCALTGMRLDRSAELDHIVPRSRGGGDEIGNLRWTVELINQAKRNLKDDEFIALCVVFLSHTCNLTINQIPPTPNHL